MCVCVSVCLSVEYIGPKSRGRKTKIGSDVDKTKKSVLQVWCCVATLVVIMTFKDTTTFQVLFIVSLFCAWNITIVEINSGVYLLKS